MKDENIYCVIDLEFARVTGETLKVFGIGTEIIQFGAVLMKDNEIVGSYNRYVKPKYAKLCKYIRRLTGIQDSDISDADEFPEVLHDFVEWLPKNAQVIPVSWSDSDLNQLRHECAFFQLDSNSLGFERWIDAQQEFSEKFGLKEKRVSLQDAINFTNIEELCEVSEKLHNALEDAYNESCIFRYLRSGQLKLNEYYKRLYDGENDVRPYSCTLGSIIESMGFVLA